jgi:hypothetical protein
MGGGGRCAALPRYVECPATTVAYAISLLARGLRCDRSPPAHPARHCCGKLHLGELSGAQIGHFQRSEEITFSDISSSSQLLECPVDRPVPAATADRFRCLAARSRPLKISCSG